MIGDSLSHGKRPRLWVVSELYYPEVTSTGYYLTQIGEGLAGDFDVKVLCGQPNYFARGQTAPKHETHKGVEIFRVAGTRLDKNVILFRLVNMLTLGISVFFNALSKFKRGDRILVVTNPPSMPFIVAFASLFKGASYTLLIHDNYPEILVAAGKTGQNSLLRRSLDFANRWLYKYTSKIIVVGRDMKELVSRKTDGLDVPVVAISNWAELESIEPAERRANTLLKKLGLAEKFVFLYAGNMGHPNDVESIVSAAEMLSRDTKIHFVFLGTGVKRKWIEKEVKERALSNVMILNPRPRSEQQEFLNACDIALVSLVGKMWGVSVPSRTYNFLAAGKPILAIAEERSELARVIEEDQVGWVVAPSDPNALSGAVRTIYSNRGRLAEMSERARNSAVTKYNVGTALLHYRSELQAMSNDLPAHELNAV